MAIAKTSILTTISGRIGAAEFAQTRTAQVIKHKRRPRRCTSPATYAIRRLRAERLALWKSTADRYRTEWEQVAATHPVTNRFGTQTYLTGFELFMSAIWDNTKPNTRTRLSRPPADNTNPVTAFTVDLHQGGPYTLDITCEDYGNTALCFAVWVARFLPIASTPRPRTWIYIGNYHYQDIATTWYDRFIAVNADLLDGEHVAVKVRAGEFNLWPATPVTVYATVQPHA